MSERCELSRYEVGMVGFDVVGCIMAHAPV